MLNKTVEIDYKEVIPESRQMPEFYADDTFHIYATLKRKDPDDEYNDRTVYVAVNGEMCLSIPTLVNGELTDDVSTYIRYGNEFEKHFKDDIQFWQFLKVMGNAGWEVYRMNPWWEIWSDDYPDGDVYDTFYEAIDGAISFINDDQYWEQY